jgi:class 3 adenylate cyclase
MTDSDIPLFEKFSRHTPRILKHQLLAQLVNHFLQSKVDIQASSHIEKYALQPSIERFHCALLFVDISGFTVLSQRLHVDALRIHINAYFKKILDIVDKFEGDVVKFAGDALFIIWQTQVRSLGEYYYFICHCCCFS